MSEIKWIKITTDMFEDEKINFIDSLPDKDMILILWIKLLSLAGKVNDRGLIYLTPEIPYTEEMLSHKFHRPVNTVKLAIETFKRLGMIYIIDAGHLAITNWEKHQSLEGMEKVRQLTKNRVQKYRENQGLPSCNATVTLRNAHVTQQNKNKNKNITDMQHSLKTEEKPDDKKNAVFEEFWTLYPSRNGKKLLKQQAKTELIRILKSADISSVLRALRNYNVSKAVQDGYARDAVRFLKGEYWREWLTPENQQANNALSESADENIILDPATGNPAQVSRPRATPRKVLL